MNKIKKYIFSVPFFIIKGKTTKNKNMNGMKENAALGLSGVNTAALVGGAIWAKNKFTEIDTKLEELHNGLVGTQAIFTGNGPVGKSYAEMHQFYNEQKTNHPNNIKAFEIIKNNQNELTIDINLLKENQRELAEKIGTLEEKIDTLVILLKEQLPELETKKLTKKKNGKKSTTPIIQPKSKTKIEIRDDPIMK